MFEQLNSMGYGKLSINLYFYNLMTDERQRGSHEIVQSREQGFLS